MNDINTLIIQSIDTIVTNRIKELNYLYKITGVIIEKIDNNTYKVQDGQNIYIINEYTTIYNVNDVVDIIIENNSSYKKILCKIGEKNI